MLRSLALPAMSRNYKNTLNLPGTEFPMKANLAAREPEMLREWEETRLYQQIQKSRDGRELFVLHDGPPFANGDVHMGTALNKILKDFVVKSQTMLGKRAPYVPGWDCHGLPIEYKVVKESRGLSPLEVRKKSEAFAWKFVNIQREQFKRLGVFGDWDNPYLTMDPKYEILSNQNERVLVAHKLYDQFIEQTGFAALEGLNVRLGKQLVGLQAQHPFLDRKSTILAADFVTMDTGTGLVHIAPGHGEDDYWLGRANGLGILFSVVGYGTFSR